MRWTILPGDRHGQGIAALASIGGHGDLGIKEGIGIGADLTRHLDDASYLTVRVAPKDVDAATRAFRAVCKENRWPLNPAVHADPDAEAGSCVCEWDHGIVSGGLPMMLGALERAIGALKSGDGQGGAEAADEPYDENDEDDEDEEYDEAYGDEACEDGAEADWSML